MAAQPSPSTDHGPQPAWLLVIDTVTVAVGTVVGLLLPVNPWPAVPVGLVACIALQVAVRVRHGRHHYGMR